MGRNNMDSSPSWYVWMSSLDKSFWIHVYWISMLNCLCVWAYLFECRPRGFAAPARTTHTTRTKENENETKPISQKQGKGEPFQPPINLWQSCWNWLICLIDLDDLIGLSDRLINCLLLELTNELTDYLFDWLTDWQAHRWINFDYLITELPH